MLVIYSLAAYLLIAGVFSLPFVLFGSRLVRWSALDVMAFVLPYATWLALMYFDVPRGPKYWTNAISEPIYIGFAVPIAALLRLVVQDSIPEGVCSIILTALLCLLAAGLALLMPPLPE